MGVKIKLEQDIIPLYKYSLEWCITVYWLHNYTCETDKSVPFKEEQEIHQKMNSRIFPLYMLAESKKYTNMQFLHRELWYRTVWVNAFKMYL